MGEKVSEKIDILAGNNRDIMDGRLVIEKMKGKSDIPDFLGLRLD